MSSLRSHTTPHRTCSATAAPHSESHGDAKGWFKPTPRTALRSVTSVLDWIQPSPVADAGGAQAPRGLALEESRLYRLATTVAISAEEGSCEVSVDTFTFFKNVAFLARPP